MTTTNTSPLALHATALLRISLGVMVLAHGLLKVFVFTLPGTVSYFESLGLPGVLAYLTIAAEVGGGLALLLGIYTRWVSLALVPVLLGAASVHLGNGVAVLETRVVAGNSLFSGRLLWWYRLV